jgi:Tfp pilus assembly protein PilF
MRYNRIKVQWGGSRATPGEWYLGVIGTYSRKNTRLEGIVISIRGLLVCGFVVAMIGYFSGAAYFWWKQNQRPYNYVRYTDVLLYPLSAEKRNQVRELQGRAIIDAGMADLEAKQWQSALRNLRMGLARYPRDLNARLKLAQLFVAYRVRDRAQDTLVEGLRFGWPGRAYLKAAIEIAAGGEDFEMVITICDRGLELHDPARHSAADRRWLEEQRIRALLAENRAQDALDYLESLSGDGDAGTASEIRLLALLQAGRIPEAVEFAEAWHARDGETTPVLRLLSRTYREAGRIDDMARVLERMRTLQRATPASHLFAMVNYFLAGEDAKGRVVLDDIIFRFGGTPATFVAAAEPLAEIDRPEEVELVIAAAAERGVRDPRLLGARIQGLIQAARWEAALAQIAELRGLLADGSDPSRAASMELLHLLVSAAADPADGAQSSLTDHIRVRQLPMRIYRQCVEVLRAAGRPETARQIASFAEGVYPNNRFLAETRTALEAELAERRLAVAATRAAPPTSPVFRSAQTFFEELDQVVATGGAKAGLALFGELRRARPAWISAADETLLRRELELHAEGRDLAAIQGAVRRYLTHDRQRHLAVVAIATRVKETGRAAEARMLLQELLRRFPGQPEATSLWEAWFPAPPAPAATEAADPSVSTAPDS